jgi:hypothetical protein
MLVVGHTRTMNLKKLTRAKKEMNWLYHEPPFRTTTGKTDAGWFCREHAFHTYFLCTSLGLPTKIALGNFCIIAPSTAINISTDKPDTHAWCITDFARPLDLSISFAHTPDFGEISSPITGVGENGEYSIRYFTDHKLFAASVKVEENLGSFSYLQRSLFSVDPESLLRAPFSFLLPGRRGAGAMTWGDLYGLDIYAKITLHLIKVANGQTRPLAQEAKAKKPVEWIRAKYSAAIPKLMKMIDPVTGNIKKNNAD